MVSAMKKGLLFLAIVVFVLGIGFTGCAKKEVKTDVGVEGPAVEHRPLAPKEFPEVGPAKEIDVGLGEDFPVVEEEVAEVRPPAGRPRRVEPAVEVEKLGLKDVFFDFDKHFIRDDARGPLKDNAKILKSNPGARITIEGHCDERGTIEYNVALGERRAKAVKKFLTDLGVDSGRMSIISYGKEKPFCTGHNEVCWQSNRRGHFVGR
jgi:peptidoglycan-associated lipoprotein